VDASTASILVNLNILRGKVDFILHSIAARTTEQELNATISEFDKVSLAHTQKKTLAQNHYLHHPQLPFHIRA
jgi:hypothetical protein